MVNIGYLTVISATEIGQLQAVAVVSETKEILKLLGETKDTNIFKTNLGRQALRQAIKIIHTNIVKHNQFLSWLYKYKYTFSYFRRCDHYVTQIIYCSYVLIIYI